TQERRILSRFIQLAGGSNARLVVIPAASAMPAEIGARYCDIFTTLGAASAQVIHIDNRKQANNPTLSSLMEGTTGIFMTGGEQLRLISYLGGTVMSRQIK